MNDNIFLDTNILIYAHDSVAGRKHQVATEIIQQLWESRLGVLSTQVLQEFYVNVTRKIPKPLSRKLARALIANYSVWQVETIAVSHVQRASEIEEQHRLSFWDALVVAAAERAHAAEILSEDLNAGQNIAGVRIVNPFTP